MLLYCCFCCAARENSTSARDGHLYHFYLDGRHWIYAGAYTEGGIIRDMTGGGGSEIVYWPRIYILYDPDALDFPEKLERDYFSAENLLWRLDLHFSLSLYLRREREHKLLYRGGARLFWNSDVIRKTKGKIECLVRLTLRHQNVVVVVDATIVATRRWSFNQDTNSRN